MSDDTALPVQPRPHPVDLALFVIGSVMLSAGYGILAGSLRPVILGFVGGCVLAAAAWQWPKVAGPMLLALSIPGMLFGLFLTFYTFGMPHALVSLWGAAAFLAGAVGVLRRRSAGRHPKKHLILQVAVIGSLAAIFLLYFVIMWPAQGKAVLLDLPIVKLAEAPYVKIEAGGNWAAYWSTARVAIPEALESVKRSLESDGWTIVDSMLDHAGGAALISAQRGAYSLVVMYDPKNPSPYASMGHYTDAYMVAYVRRA